MTADQLRQLYLARPFQPFDLHLADSRTVTVHSPEQIAFSQSGRTIAVARPDDTIETIDVILVVSVKPRPNGSARRRNK